MEVEQLPGDGGIGSRAGFFDRGLDIEPIWTKKRIGSEQVLRICSGGPRRSPLAEVRGQIFLGSDEFISRHASPERNEIREVPRVQRRAVRPTLEQILGKKARGRSVEIAYREYGYRMTEIARHLGVHYATVSRRLKALESQPLKCL